MASRFFVVFIPLLVNQLLCLVIAPVRRFALGRINPDEPYFEYLFLAAYGGTPLPMEEGAYIGLFLVSLVPQILLIFLLANYMLDDFTICSVYIFTRTNQRKTWLVRKCISLFFLAALYYILQFAVIFLLGQIAGGLTVSDPAALLPIVLSELLFLVLLGFVYVLTVNLLSLKIGIHYAFLSVALLIAGSGALALVLKNSGALKFIPLSQAMLIWHDNETLVPYRGFIGDFIPGFTVLFSVLYLLILLSALFALGMHWIEHLEILWNERED